MRFKEADNDSYVHAHVGIICKMFESLYNMETVSENSLLKWRDRPAGGVEDYGRSVAIEKSKPFFKWLETPDIESDDSDLYNVGEVTPTKVQYLMYKF